MKKITLSFLLMIPVAFAQAHLIKIYTPYTASHSGTPAMYRIIETANRMQKNHMFVLEFRPGANQTIAVKQQDLDPLRSLAIVAASFVENTENGSLAANNYVPVWSLGDACWAVMSTVSQNSTVAGLRSSKEITVGTVGVGNASHLTALLIGQKHQIPVRLIPFKSNYDAVVNMAGTNGVNFAIDTQSTLENFQSVNPQMRMLAVTCDKRLPEYPHVQTLQEQGILAPYIVNIVIANSAMPADLRQQLAVTLSRAADQIGQKEIQRLSAFNPPQFDGITSAEHFNKSMERIKLLRNKFKNEIAQAQ